MVLIKKEKESVLDTNLNSHIWGGGRVCLGENWWSLQESEWLPSIWCGKCRGKFWQWDLDWPKRSWRIDGSFEALQWSEGNVGTPLCSTPPARFWRRLVLRFEWEGIFLRKEDPQAELWLRTWPPGFVGFQKFTTLLTLSINWVGSFLYWYSPLHVG